jgi:hypothetical protein
VGPSTQRDALISKVGPIGFVRGKSISGFFCEPIFQPYWRSGFRKKGSCRR